jgi:hypothetical protein
MAGIFDFLLTRSNFVVTPLSYSPTTGTLSKDGDPFYCDAVVNESEQRGISITNYPLESGASFAEHASQLAFTISVNGIVSNASMSLLSGSSFSSSLLGQSLTNIESRTQAAYKLLTGWAEIGQPLLVQTKYKKDGYKDKTGRFIPFAIESFSIQRNAQTGDSLNFNMTLRQIYLVSIQRNQTTILPIPPGTIPTVSDKGDAAASESLKADAAAKAGKNGSVLNSASQRIIDLQKALFQSALGG